MRIDFVRIDLMGVDFVRIDLVGAPRMSNTKSKVCEWLSDTEVSQIPTCILCAYALGSH